MLGSGELDLSKIPENRKLYYEAVEKLTAKPFPLIVNKYDFNTKKGILVSTKDIITLPSGAFSGQTGLKKIIIPSSVTTINSRGFNNCTLDELVLQSPFLETNFVKNVSSWGGISYTNSWTTGAKINKLILKGYNTDNENLELNVGDYVFASSDIKTVEFDDAVNGIIGKGSFERSKLEEIIIGSDITTFGNNAFSSTDYLKTLIVKCDLSNCTAGQNVFAYSSKYSKGLLSLYLYNNTLTNYLNAAWLSFGSDYDLEKNIYINDELLKNVVIPLDITEIKFGPLVNSTIESIEIHDLVTSIDDRAFKNCFKLNNVKIGKGVSNIGVDVFLGISGEITIDSNIIGNDFPSNSNSASNNSFLKGSNFTKVIIGNNVTKIGRRAFAYLDLENIILGNGLVTIDEIAFSYCSNLTSITIPDSVTTIGTDAFSGCFFTKESFINNSGLDEIENDYWGANIYDIIQDDGLCISDNTVYDCKPKATVVTIPNNIILISFDAFKDCTRLTNVSIPNSVTKIGDNAFYNCSSLTNITIPNSVTSIGSQAFYGCTSLTSITIPDGVTEIGSDTFRNCDSLQAFYGKYASEDSKLLIKDGIVIGFAPSNTTICNVPEGISSFTIRIITKSLESLTLPSSIVSFDCTISSISINNLYCKATTPPKLTIFLSGIDFKKIYVPMDSVDAYKSATNWSSYADVIVGYDFENNISTE